MRFQLHGRLLHTREHLDSYMKCNASKRYASGFLCVGIGIFHFFRAPCQHIRQCLWKHRMFLGISSSLCAPVIHNIYFQGIREIRISYCSHSFMRMGVWAAMHYRSPEYCLKGMTFIVLKKIAIYSVRSVNSTIQGLTPISMVTNSYKCQPLFMTTRNLQGKLHRSRFSECNLMFAAMLEKPICFHSQMKIFIVQFLISDLLRYILESYLFSIWKKDSLDIFHFSLRYFLCVWLPLFVFYCYLQFAPTSFGKALRYFQLKQWRRWWRIEYMIEPATRIKQTRRAIEWWNSFSHRLFETVAFNNKQKVRSALIRKILRHVIQLSFDCCHQIASI